MGLDPIAVPSKGLDVGKTKGIMDKISDVLNWDENKETGRQIKIKQDLLMCKTEKEIEDKVNNEELTPQAARGALAAKRISIYADGPVSAGVEATQAGVIENAAKSYGYATAPAKDCAKLLNPQSGQSQFDFLKNENNKICCYTFAVDMGMWHSGPTIRRGWRSGGLLDCSLFWVGYIWLGFWFDNFVDYF